MIFADRIMALGFKEAAKAGISFGKDDMVVPKAKETLVDDTRKRVAEYETAIRRRPHHEGREVQQGRRRLVEVHRQGRRRDDGRGVRRPS